MRSTRSKTAGRLLATLIAAPFCAGAETAAPKISLIQVGSMYLKLQDLSVRWARPSTRADGSALTASEIASYQLYAVDNGAQDYRVKTVSGKYSTTTIRQPLCTRYTYAMVATDTEGRQSKLSDFVTVDSWCPGR